MKEEILAAVMFFIRFIEKSDTFPRDQLENFKKHLTELLIERFEKHWFPEVPAKGQGYRCIRVNGISPVDMTLELAASKCGLRYSDLHLPTELTVWVDPSEVCYRLGESEGSYCTLATFPSESSSALPSPSSSSLSASSLSDMSSNSTPSSSPPSTPLQDKYRKVQKPYHHHRYSLDNLSTINNSNNKYRNHVNMNMTIPPATSVRSKQAPREMNYNFIPNRHSMFRCDGPPYPMNPAYFNNIKHNRTHYKNVVRV